MHAVGEMDDITTALARKFVDTSFKPLDDWTDWDVIEQFQPAALRYQIDHMIYTIALQKYTRTPAFRGYQDEAMRRLVQKYQQKKVWSYWAYENLWGNLEWNPDPARKQNIMLTGFFALSLGAFQTVTGDLRHSEAGAIEFVWNEKRRYPYSYDSLCASLTSDYLKSPWGLVVCEPNWIFSACNMRGAGRPDDPRPPPRHPLLGHDQGRLLPRHGAGVRAARRDAELLPFGAHRDRPERRVLLDRPAADRAASRRPRLGAVARGVRGA